MKIIEQSVELIYNTTQIVELIETAGRVCYQSESKGNPKEFIKKLIKMGHESVIEHGVLSFRLITDRGVSHELVRHRLASYSQESTRYVNYGKEMKFIKPVWWDEAPLYIRKCWEYSCEQSELIYKDMIKNGAQPQEARQVLNNSLKTELIMTANIREWRHILRLRCSAKAHPQMRDLMNKVKRICIEEFNVLFYDLIEN